MSASYAICQQVIPYVSKLYQNNNRPQEKKQEQNKQNNKKKERNEGILLFAVAKTDKNTFRIYIYASLHTSFQLACMFQFVLFRICLRVGVSLVEPG